MKLRLIQDKGRVCTHVHMRICQRETERDKARDKDKKRQGDRRRHDYFPCLAPGRTSALAAFGSYKSPCILNHPHHTRLDFRSCQKVI